MSTFVWVMLAIAVFVGGQILAMRPNGRDQALMRLRETARKTGLQPRLLPPPDWLRQQHKQMVACYTLIVPAAEMPYWRAQPVNGQWQTVSGKDRLQGIEFPPVATQLLALEGQANAVSFYWNETSGEDVLEDLKSLLKALGNKA